MPTYPQLQQESWWGAEFQPPELKRLCERLRAHYNVGAVAIGSKGDNNHLSGYHRSRKWIKNSRYCVNRTYSISRTPGDRSGGDADWLCAVDMTIPRAELIAACKRLDAAVRAGRLEKITEWYGNDDGDNRVDGYDNISNVVASSDSSHLWHLHLSFDRGRAGENHDDLFDILTGVEDDMAADDVWLYDPNDTKTGVRNQPFQDDVKSNPTVQARYALERAWYEAHYANERIGKVSAVVDALTAKVEELAARPPVGPAELLAAVAAALKDPEVAAVQARANADEQSRRLAD